MHRPSDAFCVLPWLHLFANERGVIHPCCFSLATPVAAADGTTYRIDGPDEVAAAWRSEFMRGMRRQMLAGERPKVCALSYAIEDRGGTSHRQSANADFADPIPELAAATSPRGDAPQRYRYVDLRLGNECNLRCRMCSPPRVVDRRRAPKLGNPARAVGRVHVREHRVDAGEERPRAGAADGGADGWRAIMAQVASALR